MERIILFNALQFVVSLYAVARGGAPERIVGILLASAAAATFLLRASPGLRLYGIEYGAFLVDVSLLATLVVVALHADRFWPLWVVALHALGTGAHLVKALNPDVIRVVYALLMAVWSYPIMALLFLGTIRHRRRMRGAGGDLDWSHVPRRMR